MWSYYCILVFMLVVLTTSTIRNLKDVNPGVNPAIDPIHAQAVETSEV